MAAGADTRPQQEVVSLPICEPVYTAGKLPPLHRVAPHTPGMQPPKGPLLFDNKSTMPAKLSPRKHYRGAHCSQSSQKTISRNGATIPACSTTSPGAMEES